VLELTVATDVHVADEEILSWHNAYLLTDSSGRPLYT